MPIGARVSFLPVGQGTCNLIEVYDYVGLGQCKLIWLAIVDCGGESSGHPYVASCRNILMDTMTMRGTAAGKSGPYLDVMVVSHQDNDHHRIMKELLDEQHAAGTPITVGSYFRFANNVFTPNRAHKETYTEGSFQNFEISMRRALGTSAIQYFAPSGSTGLNIPNGPPTLFASADAGAGMHIGLMAMWANEKAPDVASIGIRRNTLSAYTAFTLQYPNRKSLGADFPGDATVYTMAAVNRLMTSKGIRLACDLMAAPHHGSITTACDNGDVNSLATMEAFYDNLPILGYLVVSAGAVNKHGHPHNAYIRSVIQALSNAKAHTIYTNTGNKGTLLRAADYQVTACYRRLFTLVRSAAVRGGNRKNIRDQAVMRICFYTIYDGKSSRFHPSSLGDTLPDFTAYCQGNPGAAAESDADVYWEAEDENSADDARGKGVGKTAVAMPD